MHIGDRIAEQIKEGVEAAGKQDGFELEMKTYRKSVDYFADREGQRVVMTVGPGARIVVRHWEDSRLAFDYTGYSISDAVTALVGAIPN